MSREETFTKIIKDNEGIIYKIARIYANNAEDQNDLYQEVVFQLWKSFESFRGDAKVSTWMYRIALNTALFHSKRAKKRGYNIPLENVVLQHENYDPVLEERLQLVYDQIHKLNDIEKGIILLFLDGKKHDEIASITGLSKSNIGTRIGRIKEKLRKQILK